MSVAAAAASLALASPAAASIGDGVIDDNGDPVIDVVCSIIEMPDGTTQEVCFEAQKGEPVGPADPTATPSPSEPPAPTEPAEPAEPTEPAEPSVPAEPSEPAEPAEPSAPGDPDVQPTTPSEPQPPQESAQPRDPRDAPRVLGESTSQPQQRSPRAGDAGGAGAPAAPGAGPTRTSLPNTGPDDVDPRLLMLAAGLLVVGGRLVRRSLRF